MSWRDLLPRESLPARPPSTRPDFDDLDCHEWTDGPFMYRASLDQDGLYSLKSRRSPLDRWATAGDSGTAKEILRLAALLDDLKEGRP